MRAQASKDGMTLRVIAGSNNALLLMNLDEAKRAGCLGFTIERTDLDTGARRWLPNLLRFEADALKDEELKSLKDENKPDKSKVHDMEVPSVSSARAPLQTFRWGDYTLEPGKRYRFRVIPRYESADDIIKTGKDSDNRHDFNMIGGGVSVEIATEGNVPGTSAVFFNRGAAASRAYNMRYGDNDPSKIPDALWWLSRGLEEALIKFIGRAVDSSFAVHAAVYEFQKDELLNALKAAKTRGADVQVAYHGRTRTTHGAADPKDHTAAKNAAAIAKNNIDFAKPRKAAPDDAIMHNKFVVLLKKQGDGTFKPFSVWTGSTNWTEGAIYGQLNVGHATDDPDVANAYEQYFQLLHDDAAAADMKKKTTGLGPVPVPKNRAGLRHGMTPVFSPQTQNDMIDLYTDICRSANMLMVSAPFVLHPDIRKTLFEDAPDKLRFLMLDKEGSLGKDIELIQHEPGNLISVATTIKSALHDFQGNILEDKESFHHAGVHIHSKIIAADPFGPDPVLVTGSANFSDNSTHSNDENSLVIRGDSAVMDIYVTEFMRMFEHYWFRAHLEGQTKASKDKSQDQRLMGLKADSSWTDNYYKPGTPQMRERLAFIGGNPA